MDELIDANLLNVTPCPSDNRYHMHDLVRLFAREEAYSEESAEVLQAVGKRTATVRDPQSEQPGMGQPDICSSFPIGRRFAAAARWTGTSID